WAWLAVKDGKITVAKTANGENPLVHGGKPILGCDVWEHSYYIDYRNRRPDYLKAFVDHLVNWEYVAKMYDAAMKESRGPHSRLVMQRPRINLGLASTRAAASREGSPANDIATPHRCRFGGAGFAGARRALRVQLCVTSAVRPVGRAAVEQPRHDRWMDSPPSKTGADRPWPSQRPCPRYRRMKPRLPACSTGLPSWCSVSWESSRC